MTGVGIEFAHSNKTLPLAVVPGKNRWPEVMERETALCCCSVVCSYCLRHSKLRCPVSSCTIFSGTPASKRAVAPVVRKELLVLGLGPASSHIFITIPSSLFFPTGVL